MRKLAAVRAALDVNPFELRPGGYIAHGRLDDFGDTAALDVAVIAHAAPVLDAIQPVRHRLHEIKVETPREIGGGFREAPRIEVDAGEVRPETVGRTVDGFAAQGGADAVAFVQLKSGLSSVL